MKLEEKINRLKYGLRVFALASSLAAFSFFNGCKILGDDCDVNDGGNPKIYFTHVPKVGSFDYVKGEVKNVNPDDHRISLYIKVGSSWWMKPYWSRPLSSIDECGRFSIDYTRGGIDQKANTINAYLVTPDFKPQHHKLPDTADEKVLAITSAKR